MAISKESRSRSGGPDRIDHPRPLLRIVVDSTKKPARMILIGELDCASVSLFRARASELVGTMKGDLVLDIRQLTFVNSSALAVFLTLHKRLKTHGTRLVISCPTPAARRLFELTGLDHVLWIEPFTLSLGPDSRRS